MISGFVNRIARRAEFSVLNNFQSAPQTILINSIPKAGTHLMSSMLRIGLKFMKNDSK